MFWDLSCVIARVPSHFISEGLVIYGKSKRPSGAYSIEELKKALVRIERYLRKKQEIGK